MAKLTKSETQKINKKSLESAEENSRGFPDEITTRAKTLNFVFLHSYPDLDAVLQGLNVIGRRRVRSLDFWSPKSS